VFSFFCSGGRCYDQNFLRFSAFFSKTNDIIKILHNLALFRVKNANFFWRKYFKNHNIGPRSAAVGEGVRPEVVLLGRRRRIRGLRLEDPAAHAPQGPGPKVVPSAP
jgi:hypothetical protein